MASGVAVRVETGFNDISNDPLQELVAAVPSQRNWKGMAIAILVILGVIGLVALSVVIVTPPDPGPRLRGRRIELLDILDGKLKPRYFNGTWISGESISISRVMQKKLHWPKKSLLVKNLQFLFYSHEPWSK